ncbi:unnamed protein product [Ceutorhynchus assimilis]|uniref:Uncharacterized protein n=1 Tax=Ceutorhynchus assimilis TaxID=467358 RepID=A0A9N9MN74_9CUCU|nr:unnamed protein product [Ceutorhynchus assimilis]
MFYKLLVSISVIIIVNAESDPEYEIWLNGRNITATSNSSEEMCVADTIKITKKMEELDLADLQCAQELETLIADNIGLKLIKNGTLKYLPASVRNLTIVRNNLNKIPANVFNNSTMENLNLTSNKIVTISPEAFDYMKNLTSIILDKNELAVYNLTFQECPKLKLISIRYNFIKQLSDGILKQLKHNVLSIYLSFNNIQSIHKNALDIKQFHEVHLEHNELANAQLLIKLVKAEFVDLSDNKITCLPKEFMENGLSKIRLLNLTDNPLDCKCLEDLKRKVRKNIEFQKMSPLVQNINILLPKSDMNCTNVNSKKES